MEEILKELMNTKCVSMHNNQFRCYGKKCDGQCAQFQIALDAIITKNCDILYAMLSTQDINDYNYVTAPAYNNVVDFVEDFRKATEK